MAKNIYTQDGKPKFNASRSQINMGIFKDHEMDWTFKRYFENIVCGAAEIGEMIYVAEKVKQNEDNLDLWIDGFAEVGDRLVNEGEERLAKSHKISARQSFWRAANYFAAAEYGAGPDHPRFEETWEKSVKSFHKAAALFNPPIEVIKYPFEHEGQTYQLPGYLWRPDNSTTNHPTIIISGGNDTSLEEVVWWGGVDAVKRGYNFVCFEYPGHRGCVHMYPELQKRHDLEVPYGAAIDYLETLPGIDERIAMTGYSFGGYVTNRVSFYEKRHRIKACAPNPPIIDFAGIAQMNKTYFENFFGMDTFKALDKIFEIMTPMQRAFSAYTLWTGSAAFMMPVEDNIFTVNDALGQVTMPVLGMVGEDEGEELVRQARLWYERIPSKDKRLYIFTFKDDGCIDHCMIDNHQRGNEVLYDWLDEVFNYEWEPTAFITQ